MSEKHIKEKQNSQELEKSFVVLENKLMRVIKGDAEAKFFLLLCLYYLPSDPGFFCFEVGQGCWSFCSVLSSCFFSPQGVPFCCASSKPCLFPPNAISLTHVFLTPDTSTI